MGRCAVPFIWLVSISPCRPPIPEIFLLGASYCGAFSRSPLSFPHSPLSFSRSPLSLSPTLSVLGLRYFTQHATNMMGKYKHDKRDQIEEVQRAVQLLRDMPPADVPDVCPELELL